MADRKRRFLQLDAGSFDAHLVAEAEIGAFVRARVVSARRHQEWVAEGVAGEVPTAGALIRRFASPDGGVMYWAAAAPAESLSGSSVAGSSVAGSSVASSSIAAAAPTLPPAAPLLPQVAAPSARSVLLEIVKEIVPDLSAYGLSVIELCSDMVWRDCPRARSGGAALAAALVLGVPGTERVSFMRSANDIFSDDAAITFADVSTPDFFQTFVHMSVGTQAGSFVAAARARRTVDSLAQEMAQKDAWLLGYNRSSQARPHASLVELLRWLLKGT